MIRDVHNRYWLLDGVIGWQTSSRTNIFETHDDHYLTLEPLPGPATPLLLKGELSWPVALSAHRGRLCAIDASCERIVFIEDGKDQIAASVGSEGSEPRRLRHPRGLAVLPSGSIAVADTGNNRVQIFSRVPYALLHVIPGFDRPWGLAIDAQGRLLVADRGHGCVRRFADGFDSFEDIGGGVLDQPTQLASAPGGDIAVVDRNGLVVFWSKAKESGYRRIESIESPQCVAFDSDGALYVGTRAGLLFKLLPDRSVFDRYSAVWSGPMGDALQSSVLCVLWDKKLGLVAIVHEVPDDPALPDQQRIWTSDPTGAFTMQGEFVAGPIDSEIENCTWHRVEVLASVPNQTTLEVESFTSADPKTDQKDLKFVPCLKAGSNDNDPDCLVQSGPGQYLWIKVRLGSGGTDTPKIRAIKARYPRESYLQYLPAVYQQDPESRLFLDRFLSLFQAEFDGIDQQLDNMWQLFEPMAVTGAKFQWLASWLALAIDPTWTDQQRSRALKDAFKNYTKRGTIAGIQQAISANAGVPNAGIIEDFRLRQWAALPGNQPDADVDERGQAYLCGGLRLWSRGVYDRLQVGEHSQLGQFHLMDTPVPDLEPLTWGANRFRVYFPANPYAAAEIVAKVEQVVEREKPAYTEAIVCPVLPRLRVGVQSTLDVDAAVGGVSYLVLSSTTATNLSTLGYDTILAGSKPEREMGSLGAALRPHVGVNARVL